MPYTRSELLTSVRTDHPEFSGTSDNDLFAAIAVAHPDLAKGVSEAQAQPQAQPQSDNRTWQQVASDQAANVLKGIPQAITGIPGFVGSVIGAAGSPRKQVDLLKGAAHGIADPFATTLTGAAALAAPNSFVAPSSPEWEQSAQGAGANLAALELPNVVSGAAGALSRVAPKILPEADTLMRKAATAKAYRSKIPVTDLPTTKVGFTKAALRTVPNAIAGASGYTLEQLAKLRAGMDTNPYTGTPGFEGALPEQSGSYKPEGVPQEMLPQDLPRTGGAANEVARTDTTQTPIGIGQPKGAYEPTVTAPVGVPYPPAADVGQIYAADAAYRAENAPQDFAYAPSVREVPEIPFQMPAETAPPAAQAFEHPIQPLPPDEAGILAGIFREGKGASASTGNMNLAIRNAPFLLDAIPELRGVQPGMEFDGKLFNGFQKIGHDFAAAEKSVLPSKPVATEGAVKALDAIEKEAINTLQNKEARAVAKIKAQLEERPTIPWKDLLEAKRAFGEAGVEPEISNKVYQVFKDMANEAAPELKDLNQKYYTARTAIDLAKMHAYKGLRLSEVAAQAKGIRATEGDLGKGGYLGGGLTKPEYYKWLGQGKGIQTDTPPASKPFLGGRL